MREVATGDKEATSDSYSYADSGMAEPKTSSPARRKFIPQPFFPPTVYQQDSKLLEEWQSLSEFHSAGAKDTRIPIRVRSNSEKASGESSSMQQALRSVRTQCAQCGDKYYGSQAAEMLDDHLPYCKADGDFRQQLRDVDTTLQALLGHFERGSRGALEGIIEEALGMAADEMDKLKEIQDRVKRLVKR
ncbi:hypothetical protein EON64_17165 [archaeon]|nr:MAG: hypothetical protein EON64_17165 [archaeon]